MSPQLEWVSIQPSGSEPTKFMFDRWLDLASTLEATIELEPGYSPPIAEYALAVYTGDVAEDGTDANVWCIVHGSESATPRLSLDKQVLLTSTSDLFERSSRTALHACLLIHLPARRLAIAIRLPQPQMAMGIDRGCLLVCMPCNRRDHSA